MSQAIDLDKMVSDYGTQLPQLGTVKSESERNKAYLSLMKQAGNIGELIYDINETLHGDNAKLESMMDVGASLTTAVNKVNDAVSRRIQAETVLQIGTQGAADAMAAIQVADAAARKAIEGSDANVR